MVRMMWYCILFVLWSRRPPGSTRTYALFPYATLCRAVAAVSSRRSKAAATLRAHDGLPRRLALRSPQVAGRVAVHAGRRHRGARGVDAARDHADLRVRDVGPRAVVPPRARAPDGGDRTSTLLNSSH